MENTMKARRIAFWGQERFADVKFIFPKDGGEQKVLSANKTILALSSPVFEAMFFGDLADKSDAIPILDVKPKIFKAFLRCIYLDDFHIKSLDYALKLFYVAHKYEVTAIEKTCESYIIKNVKDCDVKDLDKLISFAELFSMEDLIDLCRVYKNHNPNPELPATWVPYKKGDPLPPGIVFADIDPSNKWPLGIGCLIRDGDYKPGVFYIKDLYLDTSDCEESQDSDMHYDNFEILCYGSLNWVSVPDLTWKIDENTMKMTKIGGRTIYREDMSSFQRNYIYRNTSDYDEYVNSLSEEEEDYYGSGYDFGSSSDEEEDEEEDEVD